MITINPQKNPKAIIIWLHGLGADANDFVPFINDLNLKDFEFILPNAPFRSITINQGMKMRGWYDIKSFTFEYQDNKGLHESKKYIDELIKERCKDPSKFKIFLGGFSQGAAVSLYTGLSSTIKINGIIALSGYLPKIMNNILLKETSIIAIHGDGDDIIKLSTAKKSYRDLIESKNFSFKTYNMAHEVIYEEIIDIKNFLIENT